MDFQTLSRQLCTSLVSNLRTKLQIEICSPIHEPYIPHDTLFLFFVLILVKTLIINAKNLKDNNQKNKKQNKTKTDFLSRNSPTFLS